VAPPKLVRARAGPFGWPGQCHIGGREWMLLEGICVEGLHRTDRDGGWQSSLRIVENGTLLYEDAMESGSSKPLWNNFLVRGGDLYYIRNKRELVCVPLR